MIKGIQALAGSFIAVLAFTGFADSAQAQGIVYETVQVADGLYSFSNRVHYSMFLVTSNGVVAMDPVNPEYAAQMLASIQSITTQPVRFVIYSHDHWDHISGGQVFKDGGAVIISHSDARQSIMESPNPDVVTPDFGWQGSRRDITLGGTIIELHNFGPSHGRGMTVFRFPTQRAVFTSDLVRPQTVGFGTLPDYQPSEWIRTLAEIDALDFDFVMMGHKDHSAPRETVAEHRQYLVDLDAAVQAAIDEGQPPWSIPDTIELPQYEGWDRYDDYLSLNTWRFVAEKVMGW